jgi:predicted phage terminase large subunit-like protein
MDDANRKEIIRKIKHDMMLFGKVCIPSMFSAKSPDFHYELAGHVNNASNKQINIIAPRGHAKSSIVGGILPLHHIFFGEGKKLIVLCSRTQDHAVKLLGLIKDTLDFSDQCRQLFGYWGQHSSKSWSKSEIELKDGSMIICKGTGQQLRGIKIGNQRPSLIIIDDPEDENNTKTSEAMENNLRWLLQSAVPSLDPRKGRIIVIGTPQHERCLVETLKEMKGWTNLQYKPDMEKGIALWEDWWSIKKLKEKKAELESINRLSVFYREYMCEIVGDEDQLFRADDFRYYKGDVFLDDERQAYINMTSPEKKQIPINIFTGVDPASSTKQTADYSVIFNIGVDAESNRYVLPYYRKRATPLDIAEEIVNNYKKFYPQKTRIESVGYQEMLRQYVIKRCEDENMFIPGLNIKENPRTNKSRRLESLQPIFARGQVYMKKEMEPFINELLLFPRGKHDDLLDGFFYANKGCYPPHHETIDEQASLLSKGKGAVRHKANDWMLA